MYLSVEHGPMNIWYEFEKDKLKTKGCRALTRKKCTTSGKDWLKTQGFRAYTRKTNLAP